LAKQVPFGRNLPRVHLLLALIRVILMRMLQQAPTTYFHLAPKPGSAYRQMFVKNTRIMASILYGMFVHEEEPRTAEEIAADFRLPLEAVQEAIRYCESDPPEI